MGLFCKSQTIVIAVYTDFIFFRILCFFFIIPLVVEKQKSDLLKIAKFVMHNYSDKKVRMFYAKFTDESKTKTVFEETVF